MNTAVLLNFYSTDQCYSVNTLTCKILWESFYSQLDKSININFNSIQDILASSLAITLFKKSKCLPIVSAQIDECIPDFCNTTYIQSMLVTGRTCTSHLCSLYYLLQITIQKGKLFEQIVQHIHIKMHNYVIVYSSSCLLISHLFSFFCGTQKFYVSYVSLLAALFLYHENEWDLGLSSSKSIKCYKKYYEVFAGNTSF